MEEQAAKVQRRSCPFVRLFVFGWEKHEKTHWVGVFNDDYKRFQGLLGQ